MKIGVVDVGGGLRAIYSVGVLDRCLENDIHFDYCIGVSAGSGNLSYYMAGVKSGNYDFYTKYSFRKEYMSFYNFFKTGNYLNLDYIYGPELCGEDGESPLSIDAMRAMGDNAEIVASDVDTGLPVYFKYADMAQDDWGAIKASSNLPVFDKPYEWRGGRYYDGGLTDPIPFERAFEMGCDKVVVILTRPSSYRRKAEKDQRMALFIKKKYPLIAMALSNRAETYNRQLEKALEYQKQGKVLVLSPSTINGMDTLTRDREAMIRMYARGHKAGGAIPKFLEMKGE